MYQWEDGTVAFFSRHKKFLEFLSCGSIVETGTMHMYTCFSELVKHSLCEQSETVHNNYVSGYGAPGIQFSRQRNTSIHSPHVVCPSGHWTYEFLACDVLSACWQSDNFGQSSKNDGRRKVTSLCQSPLSTLFTCSNGAQRLPYSLVCDHSQDCLDTSDEDFCVHLSCIGSWQFECTNKEVRNKWRHKQMTRILNQFS